MNIKAKHEKSPCTRYDSIQVVGGKCTLCTHNYEDIGLI